MKYFIALPLFILFVFSIRTNPLFIDNFEVVLINTLPKTINIYDTITTFNSDTYVEKIKVVKSKVNLEEHISAMNLSGKTSVLIDTLTYFKDDAFKIIDENTISLPVELWPIYHRLKKAHEKNSFAKKYGSLKIRKLETEK